MEAVLYAIPAFVLFVVVEAWSYRRRPGPDHVGYSTKDTATSMTMGLGSVVVAVPWALVMVPTYLAAHEISPLSLSASNPLTWILLFFADDLAYYAFHRSHHRVRLFWASHVVHHSSRHYNFSTALRQSWTPMSLLPFWLPLALLGFPVWMIFLQKSISLIYQFFLHTERVDRLWRPVEWVFNTPSHHRVHHGATHPYLDCNYGGILIVWDRIFRSFVPERTRVVYGLTKNITTHNPVRVAFHEYAALWRDTVGARGWGDRARHLFGPPGWRPGVATVDVQGPVNAG